jgi:hypothetical protein
MAFTLPLKGRASINCNKTLHYSSKKGQQFAGNQFTNTQIEHKAFTTMYLFLKKALVKPLKK